MPIVICETCQNPFEKPNYYIKRNKHHYCSDNCRYRRNENAPEKRIEHFWSQVDTTTTPDGCWLWTGEPTTKGYGRFCFNKETALAHRVAYELHTGITPPKDAMVLHDCDVRLCTRPAHLRLGDHRANMDDVVERHRQRGERNGASILTEAQVAHIKALFPYQTDEQLGYKYRVTSYAIYQIRIGNNWKYVKPKST